MIYRKKPKKYMAVLYDGTEESAVEIKKTSGFYLANHLTQDGRSYLHVKPYVGKRRDIEPGTWVVVLQNRRSNRVFYYTNDEEFYSLFEEDVKG